MAAQKPDQTPDESLGARLRASDAFADVRDYVQTGLRPEDDATAPFVGLADLVPDPGEHDVMEAEDALEAPGRRRHAVLLGSVAMAGVIGLAASYAVVSGGWAGTWNPDGTPGGAPPEYSRPSGEAPTAVPTTTGSGAPVSAGSGTPSGSPKPGSSSPGATAAPDVPPGETPKPTRTSTPPSEPTGSPTARPSKKPPRPKPTPSRRERGMMHAGR